MLILLCLLALFKLIWGSIQAIQVSCDFAPVYLASSSFAKGQNPYNPVLSIWESGGGSEQDFPGKRTFPALYPLTTYTIMAPLTFFKWPLAKIILLSLNLIALLGQLIILIKLINLEYYEARAIILIAGTIALTPVHVCIGGGQLSILAIFFGIASYYFAVSKYNFFSGIFLALGLCIKPQVTIPFFIFYCIRRYWTTIGWSVLIGLIVGIIGIIHLGLGNFSWLLSWQENIRNAFALGAVNDPSMLNTRRYNLINLHYLILTFINNTIIANAIVYIIGAIEFVTTITLIRKSPNNNTFIDLVVLNILSIICLLTMYHRPYDASLLVLTIGLIICMSNNENIKYIKYIIILIFPFYIYGIGTMVNLKETGVITIGNYLVWGLLLTHKILALLILSFLLIYILFINEQKRMKKLSHDPASQLSVKSLDA